ncbi:FAD-binding oxidoreductase [Dasania marina]|uniref:FAD-binding oxidoreductase n=1 Tax=Dasania marina TaxID=471499 RepID=UPI0030DAD16E|tara:strand:+ start:13646 stop:15049 length:1404 start_codon:yes stop_codon:yes gene_type:complete
MSDIIEQLRSILGPGGVLLGDDISCRSVSFWDDRSIEAKAIVRPRNTKEVSEIMKLCHSCGQVVVPQGGRTNLVEACLSRPDDIILSLERMNTIIQIDRDNSSTIVEGGLILQTLHESLDQHELIFPLDFGARGSCTIAGAIATNAGGTMVLKYGMTKNLVLGLEVVLANGVIINGMQHFLKNNTGYDLNSLFCGSEGTLGIITKAVLRLWDKPKSCCTALVACNSFKKVSELLRFFQSSMGGGLSSYEVMWKDYYRLNAETLTPNTAPLSTDYDYYVLMEYQGGDQNVDGTLFSTSLEQAFENELIVDGVVAKTEAERIQLWDIRDNPEPLETRYDSWACFDISLKISDMEEFLNSLKTTIDSQYSRNEIYTYGHLGDGNLHIAIWVESIEDSFIHAVESIVYTELRQYSGSISAEHGIGLEKRQWLEFSRSPEEIDLMRAIKKMMDPDGILNPGKILAHENNISE